MMSDSEQVLDKHEFVCPCCHLVAWLPSVVADIDPTIKVVCSDCNLQL